LKILLGPVHVYGSLWDLIVVWITTRYFIRDSLDLRFTLWI